MRQKSGVGICNEKTQSISFAKFCMGIASLSACDNAMYSASAVDKAISV